MKNEDRDVSVVPCHPNLYKAAIPDVNIRCKVLTAPIADQHKTLLDCVAQILTNLIKSKRPTALSPEPAPAVSCADI
jgi:hypothetical protein